MIYQKHFLQEVETGGEGKGGSGGTNTDGKGAEGGGVDVDKGGEGKGGTAETVTKAEFDRVMADMHRFKKVALKATEDKKAADDTRMKEQNQWKELAEAREKEAGDLKTENQRMQDAIAYDRRFSAIREKCQTLGIRPEAVSDLEGLDLSAVTLETTSTGRLNVLGVDKFAERLKTLKPHWFAEPSKPNVNTSTTRVQGGTGNGGAVTTADLVAAEREGRKTGDLKAYHELHAKFRQQRAGGKSA